MGYEHVRSRLALVSLRMTGLKDHVLGVCAGPLGGAVKSDRVGLPHLLDCDDGAAIASLLAHLEVSFGRGVAVTSIAGRPSCREDLVTRLVNGLRPLFVCEFGAGAGPGVGCVGAVDLVDHQVEDGIRAFFADAGLGGSGLARAGFGGRLVAATSAAVRPATSSTAVAMVVRVRMVPPVVREVEDIMRLLEFLREVWGEVMMWFFRVCRTPLIRLWMVRPA